MANFTDLLNEINFTPQRLKQVADALKNVTDTIGSKAREKKIPSALDFKLYGSISRKTKINPLDDVDVLFVVGQAEKQVNENRHSITNCDYYFGSNFYQTPGNISSVVLLNTIKSAIAETYSTSIIRRNKEVINVKLTSYDVGFDIAPAFAITNMNYYLIPAADGSHFWKQTNPFTGNTFIENVNRKINGHLINTIKIIKHWFQKKRIVTPGSYHLECILANYFNNTVIQIDNLFEAIFFGLTCINDTSYLSGCPDPFNSSNLLTSGLSADDIKKIKEEAIYARGMLSSEDIFVKYINPEIA